MSCLRTSFYWTVKTVAWPVTHTYVRMKVVGAHCVPRRGPCLLVANHASYADAILLGSACPRRVTFLITEPIYGLLRLRWFYYMMGTIPVAPDAPDSGAMKAALRTLQRGGLVGIFPEGQRMPNGTLGEGKAGAALIAARSAAPVVPAAIIGAHRVMPVGSWFPRPHPVKVVFGDPLRFPSWEGRRPSKEQLGAFADQIMRKIAALMGSQAPAAAAAGSDFRKTSS